MRFACPHCQRPPATCYCPWVRPIHSAVELLILQHPQEVSQSKGTARLLHACLPNSRIEVGESFDPTHLANWLCSADKTPLLLYPASTQAGHQGMALSPPCLAPLLQAPTQLRLVVLDGTWRKSRKMLYLNPLLQALPRLALDAPPAARYAIRKAQHISQLSTLEATCAALTQLEKSAEQYAPVLAAFDAFVAQQLSLRAT